MLDRRLHRGTCPNLFSGRLVSLPAPVLRLFAAGWSVFGFCNQRVASFSKSLARDFSIFFFLQGEQNNPVLKFILVFWGGRTGQIAESEIIKTSSLDVLQDGIKISVIAPNRDGQNPL